MAEEATHKKKKTNWWVWAAVAGAAYLWYKNQSAGSTSASTVASSLAQPAILPMQSTSGSGSGTTQALTGLSAQLQAVHDALTQMQASTPNPNANPVPTATSGGTGTVATTAPSAGTSTLPAPATNLSHHHHAYTPMTITSAHQLVSTALANPGSMVTASTTGQKYIFKAGSNGQLYGASSYNKSVNEAGGQYIDHQFFSGHYTNSGSFVTNNKSQQTKYNQLTKAG